MSAHDSTTGTVRSADGTTIAYETRGEGPPVILVDGAMCCRGLGPSDALAAELAPSFTVLTYDRRGRGESGDAATYAVEREVEDLAALIDAVGGSAHVYGISSGAVLALEAASAGLPIEGLALYEAPFVVDDTRPPVPATYEPRLRELLAGGRRGAAVKHFLAVVGMPRPLIALMPLMPAWRKMKGVAPTLPYDAAIVAGTQDGRPLPAGRWAAATAPTLAIGGGKSPAWLQNAQRALAGVLPNAGHRTLEGGTHMVKAKALAPVLAEFFGRAAATPTAAPALAGAPA